MHIVVTGVSFLRNSAGEGSDCKNKGNFYSNYVQFCLRDGGNLSLFFLSFVSLAKHECNCI